MAGQNKFSILQLFQKKQAGQPLTMLTAYDYPGAMLVDEAGIDLILVGDSLGMVVMGLQSTVPVTMEECLHHTRAVRRGAPNTFIIGDMPFLSYRGGIERAVENAGLLMQAGANAVKLEGAAGGGEGCVVVVETLDGHANDTFSRYTAKG